MNETTNDDDAYAAQPGRAQPDLYEAKRAMLIERMAVSSNQWVDVHSTSSLCQPYALPTGNPSSEELAERLEIGASAEWGRR